MLTIPFTNTKKKKFTLTEYFESVEPKYSIIKITPDSSIRNYDSSNIAKSMLMMKQHQQIQFQTDVITIFKNIKIPKKIKLIYKKQMKISYFIDITKQGVGFYFIVPKLYKSILLEQCNAIWSKSTTEEVDEIKPFYLNTSLQNQIYYEKEDALSIKVDKKMNEPLNHILSVVDYIEKDDRIGILYNFMPCSQKWWREQYTQTIDKLKKGRIVDKEHTNGRYIIKSIAVELMGIMDDIIGNFVDKKKTSNNNAILEHDIDISTNTKKKKDSQIIKTQIIALSESNNINRKENNLQAICESFRTLDENNKLTYKKYGGMNSNKKDKNNTFDLKKYDYNAITNIMSVDECKMLLELPGRELQDQFKNIDRIEILQNDAPKELLEGHICIGTHEFKGKMHHIYLPKNYDKAVLPLCLLSAQGGGKTTLISNMVRDMIKANQCVIIPDFIKNCELSESIKMIAPKDRLIEIDCSDLNNLQGFGYNEIQTDENMNTFERLDMSNLQAQQVEAFVNAINVDADSRGLTSQMKRLLRASANITFFCGKQNIGDVIQCLEDHSTRHMYIDFIKQNEEAYNILIREISAVQEIDDIDKNGMIIGTKMTQGLKGIIDRIDDLESDMRTKIMFRKSCENNINFVDCMNEGKIVLIKMPEDTFFNSNTKDVITTFFLTKIILSSKLRSKQGKPRICNIILDEISQTDNAMWWIKQTLSQTRKFGIKYVFALHHLAQLKYGLDIELKSCGTSFMLLQGSDKKNYYEFKEELVPYELEDLLKLKLYHSINMIKCDSGITKFVTKLPPEPLELKALRNS